MRLWWRLLRFGFRLLYNEMAFTYDLVSHVVSLGAWRCWQRAALKHMNVQPGAPVLELAHGTGNLQLDLNNAGYRVYGYDLSPYMGRIAKAKLKKAKCAIRLARGRAQQLPFPSGTFEAVVSTFPTDFIVAPQTLREVHRVLTEGGQFIIVPNGVLTSGGVIETGIERLYRITGQRDGAATDIGSFFADFGFEAVALQEACPRSLAQVIVARKKV
jgi:ubiquinone/menaquinone biosynthesis C-methylase UbiE